MEKNELPAGWRITTDFEWFAGSIETVYIVKRWQTWTTRRRWWSPKRTTVTGWRTVYTSMFQWQAEQWAQDTIKALKGQDSEHRESQASAEGSSPRSGDSQRTPD